MATISPKIRFLAFIVAFCLPLVWTRSSWSADSQASQEPFYLTIFHTNDLHSHEDSFVEEGKNIGGMPRIAHLIREARKQKKNVLAVDGGDSFQGTGYFEAYKGETDIECLNKAGYDVYTLGNHEFDEGPLSLARQLKKAKFDIIDCNLDMTSQPELNEVVKHSVIKEVGGQKIGFIGVMSPQLAEVALKLEGVHVVETGDRWKDPVIAEIANLKKQGINKIILVSHCGAIPDKELAALPDVDLVIGAHSHTRLDPAVVIDHPDGTKAMVVQTGCFGRALGRLDLAFDADGKLLLPESKYHLIDITDRIFEEPDLKAYVTEKAAPFAELTRTFLASAEANFDGKFKMYPTDSPIGDLICDALFDAGIENGVTISLQNRGGIRGGLDQGPISLEKVRELLPFKNKMIVATVTGKTLLAALENSVSAASLGLTGGRFLEVHGLKFAWDPSLPVGKRIVYAFAQNKEGNYEPLAPDDLYRMAMNDFSFSGGEDYNFKDARDVVDTGKRLSTLFEDYLKKTKKISPLPPARFLLVTSNLAERKTDGKSDVISISYPAPDAELSIIKGSNKGVSFLNKVGTVPLESPSLLHVAKTDANGHKEIAVADLLKDKDAHKQSAGDHVWVAFILKARDKNGTTSKTVSLPIQIQ